MEIKESIRIMKALADSSRLLVLNSLKEKEQYVEELAERLSLAPSTISFHLKKLEQASLVVKRKEQYYVIYSINRQVFNRTLDELTSFNNIEKMIQDERIAQYEKKLLNTFIKNGKLVQIPTQLKKKKIVLSVILKEFKPDRLYAEQVVNQMIKWYHDDYCAIRRFFIDQGMMKRDKDHYWIVPTQ